MARIWSSYQQAVFDFVANGQGNAVVSACPGSGKTTVVEEAVKRVDPSETVLTLAFGVAIKKELETRLADRTNVTVKTLNGFGHGIIFGQTRRYIKVDKKKYENILYYDIFKKPTDKETKDLYYGSRFLVCKLIGLCKANMYFEPSDSEITDLLEEHALVLPKKIKLEQIVSQVQAAMKIGLNKTLVIDYDDQIAIPLYKGWTVPTYDKVFGDEVQDWTVAQIELASQALAPITGRGFFVGDVNQAIYQFRGADSQAMQNIINKMDCITLPLSICYRCSKAVVRRAQEKVPGVEAFHGAVEGSDTEITMGDFRRELKDGDMVLCRTTAPLVSECLRLIRNNQKAMVKGRDLGQGIIDMIDAIGYNGNDIEGFREAGVMYYGTQAEKLKRSGKEDALINLSDRWDTIVCLMANSETVSGIKRIVEDIFDDELRPGIVFMTGHKSKGLENPRIFILRPDLLPHKMAVTEEQLRAEDNLWFVMVTRAQVDLFWVIPEKEELEPL